MDSSEKAKGKEKVETREASETIIAAEGEDNSRAAGGLSPGDIGAYASPRDEATDIWAKKMLYKIKDALQKPPSYTASESISTAPASTEDRDKKLYEPRAVAIGPYHRKTENNYFRITDKHKLWCVQEVIGFHPKKEEEEEVIGDNYRRDLGRFLREMKEREREAVKFYRDRYGTDDDFGMDSQSFVEMLMLDSCFILFALSLHYNPVKVLPFVGGLEDGPWAPRDIVGASELVKTDLLLLNSQIPFFILEDVFNMQIAIHPNEYMNNEGNEGQPTIRKVALKFFGTLGLECNGSNDTETEVVHHLLHLYHMYLKPTKHRAASLPGDTFVIINPRRYLPSATELQRKSAVNFKVKKTVGVPQCVLDVTTRKSGDIQVPALGVYDHTNILLHNLINFEQSLGNTDSYITAYVAFLNHIVQREEDVELLDTRGVLEHRLTSRAEVVAVFRQLHNVIDHYKTPGYLASVYEEVNGCCNSKWRRIYADGKQRYCSNVWLSMSFVAGIALSVLALIQTIYAVEGYKRE